MQSTAGASPRTRRELREAAARAGIPVPGSRRAARQAQQCGQAEAALGQVISGRGVPGRAAHRAPGPDLLRELAGRAVRASATAVEGCARGRAGLPQPYPRTPPAGHRPGPLLLRGAFMVAAVTVLAIAIGLPRGTGPQPGLSFTDRTPTSQIEVAGSVVQQAVDGRASPHPARSTPAFSAPARPQGPAAAPTGTSCHVTYSATADSPTRFTVVLVIGNTGGTAINGWTLHWGFPQAQKIAYAWNAMVAVGEGGADATNIATDQVIPPGGSATIGFVAKREAAVPTPTGFTLNGRSCPWQAAVTVGGAVDSSTATPASADPAPDTTADTPSTESAKTSAPAPPVAPVNPGSPTGSGSPIGSGAPTGSGVPTGSGGAASGGAKARIVAQTASAAKTAGVIP